MQDIITDNNLESIKNIIEKMDKIHHIEIAKILQNNSINLTENDNGIFINLSNIEKSVLHKMYEYILFIDKQESIINIDENSKNNLESLFFCNQNILINNNKDKSTNKIEECSN